MTNGGDYEGTPMNVSEDKARCTTLVTGGTEGIGRAIALRLLDDGARVVVTGRRKEPGRLLVEEFGDRGLAFVQADATAAGEADRVAEEAASRFGPVGVLVNNVGGGTGEYGPVHELSENAWTGNIELNLMSAVRMTRAVVPQMLGLGWGRIVMISSLEGKMPTLPGIGPYVATKHALIGLTKSVALDYGEHGITCNALCPGYVEIPTRASRQGKAAAKKTGGRYSDPQANYRLLSRTGRHATLEEVANAAAFLVGPHSGAVTGTTLNVDGGSSPY
jgi:NAD(P)-dependent dehydrogenase (short-subunit alcohol dehydrogenase family)